MKFELNINKCAQCPYFRREIQSDDDFEWGVKVKYFCAYHKQYKKIWMKIEDAYNEIHEECPINENLNNSETLNIDDIRVKFAHDCGSADGGGEHWYVHYGDMKNMMEVTEEEYENTEEN